MTLAEWGRAVALRLRALVRRRRLDDDLAEEIAHHLALREAEYREAGLSPADARAAAERRFGNATLLKESSREVWTFAAVENVRRDVAYGFRSLRKSPAFASVAVLSLALGIGANAAIFQLFDALRVRPLPVRRPEELSEVRVEKARLSGSFQGSRPSVTYALWEQIRDHQRAFSGVFAWNAESFRMTRGDGSRMVRGLYVSGGFFPVLGVAPALGRLLGPPDDRPGCGAQTAVVSHAFWRRELGADPSVLGTRVVFEGRPFEIVGVAEPSFFGVEVGRRFDVAVPICAEPSLNGEEARVPRRWAWWLGVMGRKKPGWSDARASAHLRSLSPGIFEATLPSGSDAEAVRTYLGLRLEAIPAASGFSALRDDYGSPLELLLAIAGIVLVIACANLANLMLARAGAREREIAVRLAIGASRGRIVSQLLTESLLLAGIGAAIGAALAALLSRLLVSLLSAPGDPLFFDLSLDWRLLAFTAALAVATCALFGVAPALRSTAIAPKAAIASDGRGLTSSRQRLASRRVLLVVQVVLSLGLVVCSLLFVRSLRNLLTIDPGFEARGVRVAELDLSKLPIPAAGRLEPTRQILERIRALPGVASAADSVLVPLSGSGSGNDVYADGPKGRQKARTLFSWVSPGYFRVLRMPLLSGRDIDARDTASAPRIAVVNATFVRKVLGGAADPIGKRFTEPGGPSWPEATYEIVGVVGDSKYFELREEPAAIAFLPAAQQPSPYAAARFLIRSGEPFPALLASIRRAVDEVRPGIPVELSELETRIDESVRRDRLMALLAGVFGLLAAALACVGVYGLTSYSVAGRRTEFGIRVALGALPGNVVWLVLRETILVVIVGILVGLPASVAAARLLRSLLFGLTPTDLASFGAATAFLLVAGAAAAYIPARRVARVDPVAALRGE